jgi:hypothetical protein
LAFVENTALIWGDMKHRAVGNLVKVFGSELREKN